MASDFGFTQKLYQLSSSVWDHGLWGFISRTAESISARKLMPSGYESFWGFDGTDRQNVVEFRVYEGDQHDLLESRVEGLMAGLADAHKTDAEKMAAIKGSYENNGFSEDSFVPWDFKPIQDTNRFASFLFGYTAGSTYKGQPLTVQELKIPIEQRTS